MNISPLAFQLTPVLDFYVKVHFFRSDLIWLSYVFFVIRPSVIFLLPFSSALGGGGNYSSFAHFKRFSEYRSEPRYFKTFSRTQISCQCRRIHFHLLVIIHRVTPQYTFNFQITSRCTFSSPGRKCFF